MLGIDKDEKKRRHFTLLHENVEFRYHHENQGKIYWACKVAGCPGMVEEDHYKMKLIRNHDHPRAVKSEPSKRWQSNPWYHNDTTDNYKYDPKEAYNINNSIKTSKPPKPAPIPPSWHSKGDNRTPRFYYFNIPPSNSQTRSVPASVVHGHPTVGPKRNFEDSDPMSDGTESVRSMMECNTYRQQRFWIVMGILGLVALSIVAIALSFYFIDKSRLNNHMVKQNNGALHQNVSVEPVTSTTESTSHTTSQQKETITLQTDRNTLTSTQTKAAGTSTEAESTSRVTSTTLPPTQTTPPPSSSLSTAPVVFSGSLKLNKSWTPALNDSGSPEYQVFSKAIVYEIDTAFLTSPMKHIFNNSKVTGYSPGSVKVFFKITFYTVVKEDGQVDTMSVNVTDVHQTIEREVTRQQTTRTNGFLGAVMAESITIKLLNGKRRVNRDVFNFKNFLQCKEITVIIN